MDSESHYQNFVHALALANVAVGVNRETLPIDRSMLEQVNAEDSPEFGVAIYEIDPETPVEHFTIRLRRGRFVLTQCGVPHSEPDWVVSADHLRDIVRNPLRYVDEPSRLGLDWLYSRLSPAMA